MKSRCALCLALAAFFGAAGCSALDNDAATNSSTQTATPVPGEVNPDAPDASQSARTSPGMNF